MRPRLPGPPRALPAAAALIVLFLSAICAHAALVHARPCLVTLSLRPVAEHAAASTVKSGNQKPVPRLKRLQCRKLINAMEAFKDLELFRDASKYGVISIFVVTSVLFIVLCLVDTKTKLRRIIKVAGLIFIVVACFAATGLTAAVRSRMPSRTMSELNVTTDNVNEVVNNCKQDWNKTLRVPRQDNNYERILNTTIQQVWIIALVTIALFAMTDGFREYRKWRLESSARGTLQIDNSAPVEPNSGRLREDASAECVPARRDSWDSLDYDGDDPDDDPKEGICALCSMDLATRASTQLKCKHCFHRTCIANWLSKAKKIACPICTGSVNVPE